MWKKTWLEWLPASRVAELSAAFPAQRKQPLLEPKHSPTALSPPPRPAGPKLPKIPAASALAAGPSGGKAGDPSSFGMLGRPRGPSVLGPARGEGGLNTAPPRPPLATLGDEPGEQRSTTLRPPGAIPPPPRTVPTANFDLTPSRIREENDPVTRRQNLTPTAAVKDAAPPRGAAPKSALPSELRPALVVADLDATLGSTPFEVTAQDFVDLPPQAGTPENTGASTHSITEPPRKPRPKTADSAKKPGLLGLVLLATVVGLATFALVKLLFRPSATVARAPAPQPVATPAAPVTQAPSGCGIVQPAARLASVVHRPVAPLVTAALDATRASIGFAESETGAVGVGVDLVTLDVERVFSDAGKTPVRFVVPLALDAKRFIVDRNGETAPAPRSVDSEPRFAIGVSDKDWVRIQGRTTGVLWSGQVTEKTTDPRVASSASGHLVTFRRGGLSGQVLYGLLAPDGSPKGELRVVEAPGIRLSGTPDPALSGNTWLVAFAGRGTPEEEWQIVLVSGKTDDAAAVVRKFQTPPGGAGGSSIAPAVSGLGNGEFVLQWTEGKTSEYQVRVQRLGPDLEPAGDALLVSPKGANAGQGTVFARSPRALSIFIQTTQGHDELWGTSLECP